jgi:hypothetical protein
VAAEVTAVFWFERGYDAPTREEFEAWLDSLDVPVELLEYEEEEV